MNEKTRVAGCAALAAVLGLGSVVSPVFILGLKIKETGMFPLVAAGIEGMSVLTLVLLFASGLLLGILCPKRPILVGVCTMAAFPVLTLIELLSDSTSHNLFPLEMMLYLGVSLIAALGAIVGSLVYKRAHKPAGGVTTG